MSPASSSSLAPASPSPPELLRSARVRDAVAEACAADGGSIGFDRFMDIALYAPQVGYYTAARTRFGAEGDFVTAPELSPRFARALARPVAQVLDALGGGSVLEVGAGRGTLARDLLRRLDALEQPPERYLILERSASARAEQVEVLGPLTPRVGWLDGFPKPGFRGVVIGNELLDAIPAHRFRLRSAVPWELRVSVEGDELRYREAPFRDSGVRAEIERWLAPLGPLPDGYTSEFAPARGAWLASVADCLGAGLVLLSDYGYPRREYYHWQRRTGTLACHYRHRMHDDPFRLPGLEDLSIHVDFTHLAEAGTRAGLSLSGFTTQAHFLLENGVLDGLDDPQLDLQRRLESTHAIRRLTLPGEMGEVVKFIAFTRGVERAIEGFEGRDMRHRL